MVSKESIEKQLKQIDFNVHGWGRAEVKELHHIILDDEKIYECVNGVYEGGFALLLATDIRVLLIDKKPLSFLTIEDLRFDMINEIDYNHRLMGAFITIATGNKTLVFRSYNKLRLRKLIGHVQHSMAEIKKQQSSHQEGQNQHLESINQQLQTYLVAQYNQQQQLHEQLQKAQVSNDQGAIAPLPEPIQPSPELADYLYARGLLKQYQAQTGKDLQVNTAKQSRPAAVQLSVDDYNRPAYNGTSPPASLAVNAANQQLDEMYADGIEEVFGKQAPDQQSLGPAPEASALEINPLRVAYSKLPTVLRIRNRKFGLRPPFRSAPTQRKPKPEPVA